MLYPIKFKPIIKETLWGGSKLGSLLGKETGNVKKAAESWELSSVEGNLSTVANGFLAGNNIQELIEVYMGDLVGERVYDRFGLEFPLLIKFIDANDILSIQVHPDDELAKKRHNSYGKTEMWYVLQADPGSKLITGFKQSINEDIYLKHFNSGRLQEILNEEEVQDGDVFFIPAGRVHAIGPGILLAEIQQTSDVTYRIYDWDRLDKDGKGRELHTDMALAAIDYAFYSNYKTRYETVANQAQNLVHCPYFSTNLLQLDQSITRDYSLNDSFIIYMGIQGSADIHWEGGSDTLTMGETVLIPAALDQIEITPEEKAGLLEITAGI